eukprot:9002276-Pyramimonas_sp.AAC.3
MEDSPAIGNSWITPVTTVEATQFVTCDTQCGRFKAYVKRDFDMLNAMVAERNKATRRLMAALSAEDDPLAEQQPADEAPVPKRPKKELFDSIAKTVEIQVTVDGDGSSHHVRVCTSAFDRGQLMLEATPLALSLLAKKPKLHAD